MVVSKCTLFGRDSILKILKTGFLFLLFFSKVNIGLALANHLNLEGEPKEKIIKFLSDPKINPSEIKVEVLKYFLSELDADEVGSMILPEIRNLGELLAIVDGCDDQEKIEIFYHDLP